MSSEPASGPGTQERQFLERARVAHLGTADARGRPQVVPVCFAVDGQQVFIAIDGKPKRGDPRSLKRIRNLLANPAVCLTADVYAENWQRLGWVMLYGDGRLSEDPAQCASAHRLLRQRYPQYRDMALEGLPVIIIDIRRTVSWGNLARHPDA